MPARVELNRKANGERESRKLTTTILTGISDLVKRTRRKTDRKGKRQREKDIRTERDTHTDRERESKR